MPVLNMTSPLTPAVPASAVWSSKPPLLVAVPEPEAIVTVPPDVPLLVVDLPAVIDTAPP